SDCRRRPWRTAICRMAQEQRRAGGLSRGLMIRTQGRRGIPEFHGSLPGSFRFLGSFRPRGGQFTIDGFGQAMTIEVFAVQELAIWKFSGGFPGLLPSGLG